MTNLHHTPYGSVMEGRADMAVDAGLRTFAMFAMRNPTSRSASALYWTIVTLIGASLGVVVLAYTGASIATTFLITAAAFGGLSLVGHTTKKDLTGFGSFLIVGVFGLILASLVNLFMRSEAVNFAVNSLGVLIFAGLIAYDTQRLKLTYYQLGPDASTHGAPPATAR
jgi:uncharacterized protein